MEAGRLTLQRKFSAGSGGKTEGCGNAEEKCAGPQTVFAEKVFESGNCAESRSGGIRYYFLFFSIISALHGVTAFSRMISPTESAVILPDAGFFTDRICPEISASTSLYSKARSHPSVVQFTRVSPLQ